jgi:hypothetical protein
LCKVSKVSKREILLNPGLTEVLKLDLPYYQAKRNCEGVNLCIDYYESQSKIYDSQIKEINSKIESLETPIFHLYDYLNSTQLLLEN